ncbi:MAG: hypothetical protein ACR2GX_03480 [Candidatus Dormibacteria bacterium]
MDAADGEGRPISGALRARLDRLWAEAKVKGDVGASALMELGHHYQSDREDADRHRRAHECYGRASTYATDPFVKGPALVMYARACRALGDGRMAEAIERQAVAPLKVMAQRMGENGDKAAFELGRILRGQDDKLDVARMWLEVASRSDDVETSLRGYRELASLHKGQVPDAAGEKRATAAMAKLRNRIAETRFNAILNEPLDDFLSLMVAAAPRHYQIEQCWVTKFQPNVKLGNGELSGTLALYSYDTGVVDVAPSFLALRPFPWVI